MITITKRLASAVLLVALGLFLCACGTSGSQSSGTASDGGGSAASASSQAAGNESQASPENSGKHIIGVAVYDTADNEVAMFRSYLEEYIAGVCFDDVQFVYSDNLNESSDVLAFIDSIGEMGGEGIMSFYNLDLPAEVEECAKYGMYHIVASGTVSDEAFAAVEGNEYFLGAIGPMVEMEYSAGDNMVRNFVAESAGNRYFIMSGGAGLGNEMHYQRTFGMLDELETAFGVDLGKTKDVAATAEPVTIETEKLTVTISPGYISLDDMRGPVEEEFAKGTYDVVLSVIPVEPVHEMLDKAKVKVGQVDCYSQENQIMFTSGKLSYLAGKYGSLVGPSAAAMYNAVTGHAQEFRDNGKAFKIVQNFWASNSVDDFDRKYELASNITSPAFNYEDVQSLCREFNPEASLEDLRTLASACSYEDALARRS